MIAEATVILLVAILAELFRIERAIGKMRGDLARVAVKVEVLQETRETVRELERKCPLLRKEE